MNEQQYGILIFLLSGIGQIKTWLNRLDDAMLENLTWLLREALHAAEQETLRRHAPTERVKG